MNYLLYVALIGFGYILVLSMVLPRLTNAHTVTTVAVTVLLIYGSIVGMFLMLGSYLSEPGLVLYAAAVVYACMFWCWKAYTVAHQRIQLRIGVLVALGLYLAVVLYLAVFGREAGTNFRVQMDLLNFTKSYGLEDLDHAFLNVLAFLPLGILYPFLTPGLKGKTLAGMSFGMLVTVLIETGQLVLHSGTCDIDDILCNTFGALLGAAVVCALLKVKHPNADD